MNCRAPHGYEFGPFRLDTIQHRLRRDGELVPLTPKVFDLLEVLVRRNGCLVEKDELLKEIWPDTFVEEGNLTRNISILRKVLGEESSGETYIETVPKRGYRFVASVKAIHDNDLARVDSGLVAQNSSIREPNLLPAVSEHEFPTRGSLLGRRWLVLSALATLVVAMVAYSLMHRGAPVALKPEIKSLAVLPFQNLSGDPAQEYFADGMTEALISSLARIRALRVISRTSVMSYKRSRKTLPQVAQELGSDGIIEGSVQRENGRVKILIQLIHGPTDTHLWTGEYERALTDVLKLQSEITRTIADEIRIQVTPEEQARLASAATVNPAAHEAYLLGRYHLWKHIIDDHKRAIEHFERAIHLDPSYAPAHAGSSMAWQMWGIQTLAKLKQVEPQARAAVQKALELDNRLPEAYVVQGHLQFFFDRDWKGAENSIRQALEMDPNNLDGHYNYAILLMALGRFPEAIAEIQTAEQLDPLSHQVQLTFGRILFFEGKPNEAIERMKRAIEREPRSAQAHHRMGQVYEEMNQYSKALESYEKGRLLRGNTADHPAFRAIIARVYARTGKRTEARGILSGFKTYPGTLGASAYAALGDRDEAFRLLFKTVEEREDWNVVFIKSDPQFASLRPDPRWQELLRRLNFPTE